jgi:serine/threonine-protein kinase
MSLNLPPGTMVGQFQVERKLGEGGMGSVFAAIDRQSGARVALKSLNPELMKSQELRDRFLREAQAMSRLQHPNIVQFMGFVDDPRVGWFIAMEFVSGKDFDKMIQESGIIPTARAIDLFLPALAGVGYAHSLGIIHRDLKPANIMLLDDGRVKVLDFGTAKIAGEAQMTKAGQQIGTQVYMPMEQLLGRPITPQVDIYALGCTIYEMITAQLPYYHEDPIELMRMMQSQAPIPPSKHYPGNPPQLDAIILKALARDPAQRYRDCAEFAQALMAVRQSLPAAGAPTPMPGAPTGARPMQPSGVGMQPLPPMPGMPPGAPPGMRPSGVGTPLPGAPMAGAPGMPGAAPPPPMGAPGPAPGTAPTPYPGTAAAVPAAAAPSRGAPVAAILLTVVGVLGVGGGAAMLVLSPELKVAGLVTLGAAALLWLVGSILAIARASR